MSIVCATNFSDAALRASALAAELARKTGEPLRLVHVLNQIAYLMGVDPTGGSAGHLFGALTDNAIAILEQGKAAAEAAGLTADYVLVDRTGTRLGEAVADAAVQWGADLIVVGTHGRRGPSRLLLGSGAEQIIRLAPVRVMVTPTHAKP